MATVTASAAQKSVSGFFLAPPKTIEKAVILRATTLIYSITASATAVLLMTPVPKGCQVHDVTLTWKGLGGASLTVNVGDSVSATRYINAASITAGSGMARLGGFMTGQTIGNGQAVAGMGYSYSADDIVQIALTGVGSGSTTNATTFRLNVMYSMDNNQKG